jgi:spermidine/putrescine transport system permease protein
MVEQRNIMGKIIHPLFVLGIYFFMYLPIIVLVAFSFNDSDVSFYWHGFTWDWYHQLWSSQEIIDAFCVSLTVATCSTLLSVILGTFLVVASYWWQPWFLYGIFYSNIFLPDIILAIGLMMLFITLNIPLGYPSLITGHTLIGLGFVIPIVRASFIEFDTYLIEASLDLGASYFQTCRRIIFPLLKPALIASSLLVFTLSLDDFMISFFCSGPEVQTLSVYVYYQIRTLVNPSINAISTCILAISSLLVMLLCYFQVLDKAISND